MNPLMLQDRLAEELKKIFKGHQLKNKDGKFVPVAIHTQYTPLSEGRTKNTESNPPYIRVMLIGGTDPNENDPNVCEVVFEIATCDESFDYQGYRDCINLYGSMYQHFVQKRIIDGRYELQYPIEWNVDDIRAYPYFYVYMSTKWTVGKVAFEDSNT